MVTKIVSVILAQGLKTKAHMLCLTCSVGHFSFSFLCFHSCDFFPPYPCYIEKQVQVFLAGLPELISYQANLFERIPTKNN